MRKLKPDAPVKEAKHLNLNQIMRLLEYVWDKKYGLAIWIQLYLGLRAGEFIALRWEDIDLGTRRITIRRTFVKKTQQFRDYPKGGKQHSHTIPVELLQMLIEARRKATADFVVNSPRGNCLLYRRYQVKSKPHPRGFEPLTPRFVV